MATPVVAILGVAVTQVVMYQLILGVMYEAFGVGPGGSTIWAVKTVTCVFMGAAFVALAWWAAPDRKAGAAAVAFGLVLLWGGTLMAGAFVPEFFAWLFAMGAAGVAGGGAALWFGQRRLAPRG